MSHETLGSDFTFEGREKGAGFSRSRPRTLHEFFFGSIQENQCPQGCYGALVIILDRMQRVQTLIFLMVPDEMTLTFCRFGYEIFFVRLCAWLTLYPFSGRLPHTSQIRDISHSPFHRYFSFCFYLAASTKAILNWNRVSSRSFCS